MSIVTLTKRQFNKLSNKEKRILIAYDVLEQIKIGRFIPSRGRYFETRSVNRIPTRPKLQLSNNLSKLEKCYVCAKGACVVAAIERFNQVQATESNIDRLYAGRLPKELEDIFPADMWRMMEGVFEGYYYHSIEYMRLSNEEKLINIMTNIIYNNGDYLFNNGFPTDFIPDISNILKKIDNKTIFTKIKRLFIGK